MANNCGLDNLGNTCYMNAVLQILIHCKVLRDYLEQKTFVGFLVQNLRKNSMNVRQEIRRTFSCQLYRLLLGTVQQP